MTNIYQKSLIARNIAVSAALGLVGTAHAEGATSEDAFVLEEVVVTANKRSQTIQDVAASITAIGSQELAAKGIKDMSDLQYVVPSFHFGSTLGNQNISIRGIGSFARQPGVAVSIDGIYQSRSSTAQIYQLDLERVEVLRGPQGTLYGRNSNGGVVNFLSASPTRRVEGLIRVGYAEFDEGKIQAVYSGPITDSVGIRVALDRTDRGEGWIENQVSGNDDQMQGEYSNVRVKLAADLTERLSVNLIYAKGVSKGPLDHLTRLTENRDLPKSIGTSAQLASATATTKPLETYADAKLDSDRDYELFGLTANWDLGFAALRSITAQQDFEDEMLFDRDGTAADITAGHDFGNTDTFTQEFNLVGSSERFDWVLGAFYMHEEFDRRVNFQNTPGFGGAPFSSVLDFNQSEFETDSVSVFFDGTWNITDRVRVSGGIRRTEDDVTEKHKNTFTVQTPIGDLENITCDNDVKEEWGATTVRLGGQYDISAESNIYATYSEGYKAGGIGQFECSPAYDPEFVDAYEIGYKTTFGGGRTSLNTAVFYYDYTDFQVFQVIGASTSIVNAGDAEITGFELELTTKLTESLSLSGGLTLLDSEYKGFTNLDGMNPQLGVQDLEGNTLNSAPNTSLNLGVAYSVDAPWGGMLTLRADAAFRSRVYFREFNENDDSQSAYTVLNLNVSWQSEGRGWEARLFAKNATNEEYITSMQGVDSFGARFGSWGAPRQVGIEVTRRFGQ